MAKPTFYLKNPSGKKSAVYCNFNYDQRKVQFAIGLSIETKYWSKERATVKHQAAHMDFYKPTIEYLERVASLVEAYYWERKAAGVTPSPDSIKAHFRQEFAVGEAKADGQAETFFGRFDQFISISEATKAANTVKTYRTVRKAMFAFSPKMDFGDVDQAFAERYTAKRIKEGYYSDSISKHIQILCVFMRWAMERGYHGNRAFESFKAKRKPKNDIVTLTESELNRIYLHDFSERPTLAKYRDLFLFMCHTGQRWSDIEAFNPNDIKGEMWDFISVKTGKRIRVPLNTEFTKRAKEMLARNGGDLPKISSQRFNDHLKEIGQAVGIDSEVCIIRYSGKNKIEIRKPKHEFMSSHIARRTFITVLLRRGVPIPVIKQISGHSELKTLQKYLNDTQEEGMFDALNVDISAPLLTVTKSA